MSAYELTFSGLMKSELRMEIVLTSIVGKLSESENEPARNGPVRSLGPQVRGLFYGQIAGTSSTFNIQVGEFSTSRASNTRHTSTRLGNCPKIL